MTLKIELLKLRILMFIGGQLMLIAPQTEATKRTTKFYETLAAEVAQECERER